MNSLREAVQEYLAIRRALGFKLQNHQGVLEKFVTFLEHEGAAHITIQIALRWAKRPENTQPAHWTSRLSMVRLFAKHRSATDPRTEIPPVGLLPHRYRRPAPYIYIDAQITQLVEVATQVPSNTGLRGWAYSTLFGLLAVTGLRVSEATALNREDVDLVRGVLTIRNTKFGKTRLIPVHISTRNVLHEYVQVRDRFHPEPLTAAFFLAERGARISTWMVRRTFIKLSHQIGLRAATDNHGPRLQDLRHTFATKTLANWYRAGLDIDSQMPLLSTYLGHTHASDTYWYLSATPELISLACARLERSLGELP